MSAGPRLQLRLGQQLKLAPQLRQAIALLQLNRLELREHINEILEANPLLEQEGTEGETDSSAADEAPAEPELDRGDEDYEDWGNLPEGFSTVSEGPTADQLAADNSGDSLAQHLLWQLNLSRFSETDEAIARAIIFALDEDGYLHDDLDTIRTSLAPEYLVSLEEVSAVLNRVQHFEPIGVASRDLRECLLIQLAAQPGDLPWRGLAERIVERHLDLLSRQDLSAIERATGFEPEAVQAAVALIRSMDPRPGSRFSVGNEEYVVPDVYVHPGEDGWRVTLNPDNDPRLTLNGFYMGLIKKARGEDAKYLKDRLQEARWLISGLELRNNTLITVTRTIMERQGEFLEHGDVAMQPLVQREIAEALEIHESTVSRATTRKYVHTPRGTFELKYFFSSAVPTAAGGEISAVAVKARIRRLIAAEPPGKPLSDKALADALAEDGTMIARRTVAKYRESLGIPTSSIRRRLHRLETQERADG